MLDIIIPTYNREPFLDRCIQSVLNQTSDQWNLIIVNDASTDDTKKLLKKYSKHPKIKIIHRKENAGAPAIPVNQGIRAGKNPWVAVLDSDDIILPNAIEVMLNYVDTHDVDLAYSQKLELHDNETRLSMTSTIPYSLNSLKLWCIIGQFCVYKRDLFNHVNGIDSTFIKAEDYDLYLRMALAGAKIARVNEVLYHITRYSNHVSETTGNVNEDKLRLAMKCSKIKNLTKHHVQFN